MLWCPSTTRWCARSRSWSQPTNVNFNIATYQAADPSLRHAPPTTKTRRNKQWASDCRLLASSHNFFPPRVLSVKTISLNYKFEKNRKNTKKYFQNKKKTWEKRQQQKPGKFLFSYDNKNIKNLRKKCCVMNNYISRSRIRDVFFSE